MPAIQPTGCQPPLPAGTSELCWWLVQYSAQYMKWHEIKIVSDRSGYYWGVRYTPGRVSAVHWEKHGGTSCAQHSSPVASYGHPYHPGALSQYMAQMAIKGYSTNKYPMKGCLMFPNKCTVSMSWKHKHLLDHICIDSLYWHSWFIRAGCIIKNPPSHCKGSIRYPWPQHKIYFKRQTSINTTWPIKVAASLQHYFLNFLGLRPLLHWLGPPWPMWREFVLPETLTNRNMNKILKS